MVCVIIQPIYGHCRQLLNNKYLIKFRPFYVKIHHTKGQFVDPIQDLASAEEAAFKYFKHFEAAMDRELLILALVCLPILTIVQVRDMV